MGWAKATPNPMAWRPKAGRWAGPAPGNVSGTGSTGAGNMFCVPLFLPTCEIDQIACEITTAVASSVCRIGLYLDDGEGLPGALLAEADTTVDSSTTGNKELALALSLTEGLYWGAFMVDTAASSVGYRCVAASFGMPAVTSDTFARFRNGTFDQGRSGYLRQSITAGAMPATFGTLSVAHAAPLIGVRFA